MKLELGKKYINAEGEIVKILWYNKTAKYPFCNNEDSYLPNGRAWKSEESDDDLICEVVDSIFYEYNKGNISKKEFISKHIEYWKYK